MTELNFAGNPRLGETPRFKTACRTCRDRKVKCDKVQPCRNCTLAGIVCSFPPQVRTVRRPKRAGASAASKDERSFVDRFNQLEALLKRHAPHLLIADDDGDGKTGGEEHKEAGENSSPEQEKPMPGAVLDNEQGQWSASPFSAAPYTLQSTTNGDHSDISYWTRLEEDCASSVLINTPSVTHSHGEFNYPGATPSANQSQAASNNPPSRTGFPFQQPVGTFPPSLLPLKQRRVCWSRFVDNIDPMVKILHKPTMKAVISAHDANCCSLNPSIGALIQAICLLAVASMSEEDVSTSFECVKEAVLQKCASLTEQSLQAANFLDAPDLSTVQALLLYLYYLKHRGDSRLYALCGAAIHLANRMGLNRNTVSSGMSCLEVELRRRLWWQLLTLVDHPDDFGVEGIAPSVCTDEKLPLNVNDCELEFAGAAAGEEHDGFTESSFCLMQYEITKTFNHIKSERSLTPAGRNLVADRAEHRLHATRDAMEAKYFRYSSGESPISRFAAHIIAMILAKRRLLLHISPPYNQHSHSLPPRTCDLLFLLGIHVLELSRTVQKARCFERWRWLGASYFQWSAATFVASELAARPQSPATRRAWQVVNGLLDDWPEATRCLAKAAALKALITNAIRNRDAGNIWNMGIPSELDDQNQYGLPSETVQGNASAGKKKGESQTDHDQQQLDLSTLGQEFDLEDFVLSEMSFDQNAFSTDFTFT